MTIRQGFRLIGKEGLLSEDEIGRSFNNLSDILQFISEKLKSQEDVSFINPQDLLLFIDRCLEGYVRFKDVVKAVPNEDNEVEYLEIGRNGAVVAVEDKTRHLEVVLCKIRSDV